MSQTTPQNLDPKQWTALVASMGFSQADLARETGLRQSTISRYLNKKIKPRLSFGEALLSIAERRMRHYEKQMGLLRHSVAAARCGGETRPLTKTSSRRG